MQGDFDEALQIHGHCLEERVHVLGPLHPEVATIISSKGLFLKLMCSELGDKQYLQSAIEMLERAKMDLFSDHLMDLINIRVGLLGLYAAQDFGLTVHPSSVNAQGGADIRRSNFSWDT